MEKLDTQGFSSLHIILLIVVAGMVGGTGYFVYRQQQEVNKPSPDYTALADQAKKEADEKEKTKEEEKVDNSIQEVNITMQTAADINKLPGYTPASFKSYILNILQDNKYYYNSIDNVDTITQYSVSKISRVNISGGQAPIDKYGEGHAGGAPIIWVLTPSGTWDEETLNGPVCKSKNGGLIYEEFAKECQDGDSWVKNPNGSITSIN